MGMEEIILRYAPDYWDKNCYDIRKEFPINKYCEEYRTIETEIKRATQQNNFNISCIKRNQNIHDYGQLILREQLLAVSNPQKNYYRVRRYITVRKIYLNDVLEYNIDPRRCGLSSLSFQARVNCTYFDNVILIVQVVTSDYSASSITPKNSSEYFIDYIVER